MALQINISIQLSLMIALAFHDWISIYPLNDIEALKKYESFSSRMTTTIINISFSGVAIFLTYLSYIKNNLLMSMGVIAIYSLFTFGATFVWWKPYFFGCSEKHRLGLIEYQNTHHFLPAIKNNPIPNTLHVTLHVQIILCLIVSIIHGLHLLKN